MNSFFGEVNLLLVAEALEAAIEISGGFESLSHRKLYSFSLFQYKSEAYSVRPFQGDKRWLRIIQFKNQFNPV